jgi:hypothetical protein
MRRKRHMCAAHFTCLKTKLSRVRIIAVPRGLGDHAIREDREAFEDEARAQADHTI